MSLLSKPVLVDPYSGEVSRVNPVPDRALVERKKPSAAAGLSQSGVGRISWDEVEGYIDDWTVNKERSEIAAMVTHFRLAPTPKAASDLEDAFVASNAKTDKERKETGRKGQIMGLALFPHFYPNILNVVPSEFLDTNEVVDVPQFPQKHPRFAEQSAQGERLRAFFNGFEGTTREQASQFTEVPKASLIDFCVGSSEACRSTCLVLSGNNPASTPAVAKKANLTRALLTNPALFAAGLFVALDDLAKRKAKSNIDTVVRLNMLSDIPWYSVCPELLERLSDPQRGSKRIYFYDYTKIPFWKSKDYKALGQSIGLSPGEVLDLTFSFSGDNANTLLCKQALALRDGALGYPDGVRIAMAFAPADPERLTTYAQRTTWDEILEAGQSSGIVRMRGSKVIINLPELGGAHALVDGDGSDYRIDDPGGCVVALNFKQPAVTDESVPGITRRVRESRKTFTAKVPGGAEWHSAYAKASAAVAAAWEELNERVQAKKPNEEKIKKAEASLKVKQKKLESIEAARPAPRRKNPGLPVLTDTGNAPAAVAEGLLRFSMFQVGDLLIGPHVPTMLND